MLINGKLVDATSGKTYPVINPANEETVANLPLGGKEEVNMAVEAAKNAFLLSLEKNDENFLSKYNLGMTFAKLNLFDKSIDIHRTLFQNIPQIYIILTVYENLASSIGLNYASSFFIVSGDTILGSTTAPSDTFCSPS